jgi:hypothetical protein
MKKYPKWFIKTHKHRVENRLCPNKWIEVWAFVNPDGLLIGPIGVCPKCLEIVEIEKQLKEVGYPK